MEYFISVDGEAQGPYSVEDLSNLYTAGNINETSMIWYEGLETWANLSELPLYEEIKAAGNAAEIQQDTTAEYTGKLKINLCPTFSTILNKNF